MFYVDRNKKLNFDYSFKPDAMLVADLKVYSELATVTTPKAGGKGGITPAEGSIKPKSAKTEQVPVDMTQPVFVSLIGEFKRACRACALYMKTCLFSDVKVA